MNALSPMGQALATTALSTRPPHATAGADAALISLGVQYDAAVAAHEIACADPADELEGKLSGATYRVLADLEDEIEELEATTIAGLRTKAAVVAQQHHRAMEEDDSFGRVKLQLVSGVQALASADEASRGADARLLALGAELLRAEQQQQEAWALAEGEHNDEGPLTLAAEAAADAAGKIIDQTLELRATTFAGLRVKALGIRCIYQPDPVDLESLFGISPGEPATSDHRLIYGLLSDLLEIHPNDGTYLDAELLALRPEYDRLKVEYDKYDNDPDADHHADGGAAFDAFCAKVVAMPRARTREGRAFKAQAALVLHEYVDGRGTADNAIRTVLQELVDGARP